MDTEQLSAWCRERGIFPHHVKQWKKEFAQGASKSSSSDKARIKRLTGELKSVEKELRRKEKALAEAAALLVLKKSRPDMGNRRGRLTLSEHRGEIIAAVDEAVKCGARRSEACQVAGISIRTLQRWREPDNVHDGRTDARHEPANKLGEEERKKIVEVANSPGYSELPPCRIVPLLADSGRYIVSESTFCRVLKRRGQMTHRHRWKPGSRKKPEELAATGPNQVYIWDITWVPATIRGMYFYLYMVMDIYSRKIVGWQLYERESSARAADLMTDICQREGIVPIR